MQLLGQQVKHISFGKGTISNICGSIVTVDFAHEEKRFIYPEAFSRYLTLNDASKQKEINAKYNKRLLAEEAERKKELDRQEQLRQLSIMKIEPDSQAAFNIILKDAKHIIESGCISTGCYLSGASKGKPRIPVRLKPNYACLLTGLPVNGRENDRRILGVCMVKDDFWGKQCTDGIVKCHGSHKICLPSNINLPYWNYFEHQGAFPRWGKVVFKYFPNTAMHDILLDIIKVLSNTKHEEAAIKIYEYFCRINRIPACATKAKNQI